MACGPNASTEMEEAKREPLTVQRKTAPDRYWHRNFPHWSRSHNTLEQMQNCKRKKNYKYSRMCSDIGNSYRGNKLLEMSLTWEDKLASGVLLPNSPSKLHHSSKLFTFCFEKQLKEVCQGRHTLKSSNSTKTPVRCQNTAHAFKSNLKKWK